jgi:hypothetical protein
MENIISFKLIVGKTNRKKEKTGNSIYTFPLKSVSEN